MLRAMVPELTALVPSGTAPIGRRRFQPFAHAHRLETIGGNVRLPVSGRPSCDRSSHSVSGWRQIGLFAMRRTVGFSWDRRLAAEGKAVSVGRAQWPAAHSRPQSLQPDDGLIVRSRRRRWPSLRQLQAERLADYGIFADAQPATDFAGANAFVPPSDERRRPFRCPLLCHKLPLPSNLGKKGARPVSRSDQRRQRGQYLIPLSSYSTRGMIRLSETADISCAT